MRSTEFMAASACTATCTQNLSVCVYCSADTKPTATQPTGILRSRYSPSSGMSCVAVAYAATAKAVSEPTNSRRMHSQAESSFEV
jgi:hypothetical protein